MKTPQGTEFEELLTPAHVSKMLAIDSKTVTRWADQGLIASVRLPSGHRRYRLSDVMAILNGRHGKQS